MVVGRVPSKNNAAYSIPAPPSDPMARSYQFSFFTDSTQRDGLVAVGLCGRGKEHQALLVPSGSTTPEDPFVEPDFGAAVSGAAAFDEEKGEFHHNEWNESGLAELTAKINETFQTYAADALARVAGRPGYEHAEITIAVTGRGLQFAFAEPTPDRRPHAITAGRCGWFHCLLRVLSLGLWDDRRSHYS